jgi:hypothetical protein
MVVGVYGPTNRIHNRKVMRLFGEHWQMFAKPNSSRRSGDRLEWTSVLSGRVWFHVPCIDMRCSTTKKEKDDGLCLSTFGHTLQWICCN